MCWQEIVEKYPQQWIIIEAIDWNIEDGMREINFACFIKTFESDYNAAFVFYMQRQGENSSKDFYFIHTSRSKFYMHENVWAALKAIAVKSIANRYGDMVSESA